MNKVELAKNPNTPPETLKILATDEEWVRCRVARNLNTSPETLEVLATDKEDWIRRNVAQNPNTPKYILIYFRFLSYINVYSES